MIKWWFGYRLTDTETDIQECLQMDRTYGQTCAQAPKHIAPLQTGSALIVVKNLFCFKLLIFVFLLLGQIQSWATFSCWINMQI